MSKRWGLQSADPLTHWEIHKDTSAGWNTMQLPTGRELRFMGREGWIVKASC